MDRSVLRIERSCFRRRCRARWRPIAAEREGVHRGLELPFGLHKPGIGPRTSRNPPWWPPRRPPNHRRECVARPVIRLPATLLWSSAGPMLTRCSPWTGDREAIRIAIRIGRGTVRRSLELRRCAIIFPRSPTTRRCLVRQYASWKPLPANPNTAGHCLPRRDGYQGDQR